MKKILGYIIKLMMLLAKLMICLLVGMIGNVLFFGAIYLFFIGATTNNILALVASVICYILLVFGFK